MILGPTGNFKTRYNPRDLSTGKPMTRTSLLCAAILTLTTLTARAADPPKPPTPGPGDAALASYFRTEVNAIAQSSLASIHTAADWDAAKGELRRQLAEMLGLYPWPERTDLKPVVTGKLDHEFFTVEKVHFQSRPGLYVTGNLWIPKNLTAPAPAILYVCGHGNVKKDGVSYGAKVFYQHWGGYLARAGYVCLLIDTIELGELECTHHGTYRDKLWWWHDRGYTPAGVEAWNAIRALDYLETRPEVDKTRLGVTGRSGGGAYSWWTAALDDRVKVAVPTAGITDLENHVIDGAIEGHCDCMYMVNTYRWDFDAVASLVAPRPLLIENTDKDNIFPLDGVERLHAKTKRIYDLTKSAEKNFSLTITEGPHKDTQDLQVPALHWFNRFFKNDESPIEFTAKPFFKPEELKVFKELPTDNRNTDIHDWFVPQAPPPQVPADTATWSLMRDQWMNALKAKTFHGWPDHDADLDLKTHEPVTTPQGLTFQAHDLTTQHDVRVPLFVVRTQTSDPTQPIVLQVLDDSTWEQWRQDAPPDLLKPYPPPLAVSHLADVHRSPEQLNSDKSIHVYFPPRGVGPTAYTSDEKKHNQLLRRYPLIGQTLEGMQVYDVRRAIAAIRSMPQFAKTPIELRANGRMAGVALYASLFEDNIATLELTDLPRSHVDGPHLLNVLKTLDLPAALAMAAARSKTILYTADPTNWQYPLAVAQALKWPEKQLEIRRFPTGK